MEDHYVWRPGAAPARPPRPLWPRVTGVAVAIGAQIALYLMLRHIAIATMPAWAHHFHHHPAPVSTGPVVVGVDVVAAAPQATPAALPPFPAPPLQPVPLVPVPPPQLSGDRQDGERP